MPAEKMIAIRIAKSMRLMRPSLFEGRLRQRGLSGAHTLIIRNWMHPIYLANEGTTAVGVMAVALAIAFLMVIGLGAYVLHCDAQNRAGETRLAVAEAEVVPSAPLETHAVAEESSPVAGGPGSVVAAPARRRRTRPPGDH